MRRKTKVILFSYAAAALTVFGVFLYQGHKNLSAYRLAAKYTSGMAFEETVGAVDGLSTALEKSIYASDSGMCSKICTQIYARALAAETAMSALPFSTQEMEQVSAFLNMAGDYAYTLNFQASQEGFSEEQKETLYEMSKTAAEFAEFLSLARSAVYEGSLIIDSREEKIQNVFGEDETEKLSQRLLQYESEFRPMGELVYDGRYGKEPEKSAGGTLTQEEILSLAAEYVETEPSNLRKEYDYEGTEGRSCYSVGDVMICVSPAGVESFSGSRLVGEMRISAEEAEKKAAEFLQKHGFENMELAERKLNGAVMNLSYSKKENGAVCLDNCLRVSVAMDDGSIYSFDSCDYSGGDSEAEWKIDEKTAAGKLPDSLKCAESRKVIRKSPGGKDMACWEFSCVNDKGRGVKIYVDAEEGEQFDIVMEDRKS